VSAKRGAICGIIKVRKATDKSVLFFMFYEKGILMSDRSRVKMRERKARSHTHVPNKRGNGTNREMKPGRPEKAERYIKESINCIE
jgi:hypothetical protein